MNTVTISRELAERLISASLVCTGQDCPAFHHDLALAGDELRAALDSKQTNFTDPAWVGHEWTPIGIHSDKCQHCGVTAIGGINGRERDKEHCSARAAWLKSASTSAALDQPNGWRPIETAPRDGIEFVVYCPGAHGIKHMASLCAWHEDAGFCVDELREPTHWQPLPPPPATEKP